MQDMFHGIDGILDGDLKIGIKPANRSWPTIVLFNRTHFDSR